jgi:hypothetical protein
MLRYEHVLVFGIATSKGDVTNVDHERNFVRSVGVVRWSSARSVRSFVCVFKECKKCAFVCVCVQECKKCALVCMVYQLLRMLCCVGKLSHRVNVKVQIV